MAKPLIQEDKGENLLVILELGWTEKNLEANRSEIISPELKGIIEEDKIEYIINRMLVTHSVGKELEKISRTYILPYKIEGGGTLMKRGSYSIRLWK